MVPALAGVGLLAAMMVSQPWWTLSIVGTVYMVSLPFSIAQFRKLQRAAELMRTEIEEPVPESQYPEPPESQATEATTPEGEPRKPV